MLRGDVLSNCLTNCLTGQLGSHPVALGSADNLGPHRVANNLVSDIVAIVQRAEPRAGLRVYRHFCRR